MTKLRCSVCTKLKMKLKGWRNFSERWITGAESVHNSNIRDHAQSDQHECAYESAEARASYREQCSDQLVRADSESA